MEQTAEPPTFAKIVDVMKEVEVDDAILREDSTYYLTNTKVKAKMMTTLRDSSATNALMIYDNPYDLLVGQKVQVYKFSSEQP